MGLWSEIWGQNTESFAQMADGQEARAGRLGVSLHMVSCGHCIGTSNKETRFLSLWLKTSKSAKAKDTGAF